MDFLPITLQTLASTDASLKLMLARLDRDALCTKPAPHEWSIVEVLCHLRDLEVEVFPQRTELIRRNDGSTIQSFDESAWARDRKYESADPEQALDAFLAARKKNLPVLRQIQSNELSKTGVHSEFGKMSLRELLADWAGSDLVHTAQIQRIRLWRFYPDLGAFQKYFKTALRIKD
jgi:hypothetical protein